MQTANRVPRYSRRSALGAFWLSALGASAVLGGCVVAPVPEEAVYAPVAPPAPQPEVIPAAPYMGAVWIHGFWNWSGGRHVWIPGHYVHARAGYRWAPRHWVRGAHGQWELRGGHWVR